MNFSSNLEKVKFNSSIDRINSNIDYAVKQGLEFTNYHQEFQQNMLKYGGIKLTKSGKISKKSNLTQAQLKELERTSKIASRFRKKYGADIKKVVEVQQFLNTAIEFIYEKIKNAETEEEFKLAKKFDQMLEDGLNNYEYSEIWEILNKLDAFNSNWNFNPFMDKYPSRSERKKMKYKGKER